MSVSKINYTSSNYIDVPSWVNDKNKAARKNVYKPALKPLNYDTYTTSSPKRSRKKKKSYSKTGILALLVAAGLLSPKINDMIIKQDDNIIIIQDDDKTDEPVIYIDSNTQDTNETQKIIIETPQTKEDEQAQDLLNAIKESDEHSSVRLESLEEAFNLSELEIAKMLIYLCTAEEWGNNCIDPLLFYAQICQESNAEFDAKGDYSKSKGEYLAHGFGQFHECAVDEVNKQIEEGFYGDFLYNNGNKYQYSDRTDPKKALEMMILLLRYDAQKTDSTDAMLAMYNRGHKNGINTQEGQEYVDAVYSQIDN